MGNRRKKYTEEQITQILTESEVSNNVSDTLRKYGVNDSSHYRWKAKYSGMDSKSIQRLRELERENARLKRIVSDQMLDITMLKDINSKNWESPKYEEPPPHIFRFVCQYNGQSICRKDGILKSRGNIDILYLGGNGRFVFI